MSISSVVFFFYRAASIFLLLINLPFIFCITCFKCSVLLIFPNIFNLQIPSQFILTFVTSRFSRKVRTFLLALNTVRLSVSRLYFWNVL